MKALSVDNYPRRGHHYQGFPLRNFGNENAYGKVTVDECQYLCQIARECLYYNHNVDKVCWLKFGIGFKKKVDDPDPSRYIGNKYSSGEELQMRIMFLNFQNFS